MKVTWAKDNRDIRPGGNYKITLVENTATLTILKVGKGDAGLYTCYASNSAGKDSCAAQLSFKGTLLKSANFFSCFSVQLKKLKGIYRSFWP